MTNYTPVSSEACLRARGLLTERVRDALDADDLGWLTDHLSVCDDCVAALDLEISLALDEGTLRTLPAPPLPADLAPVVADALTGHFGRLWPAVTRALSDATGAVAWEIETQRDLIVAGLRALQAGSSHDAARVRVKGAVRTRGSVSPRGSDARAGGRTHLEDVHGQRLGPYELDDEWTPGISQGTFRLAARLGSEVEGGTIICSVRLTDEATVSFEAEPWQHGPDGEWRAEFEAGGFPDDLELEIPGERIRLILEPRAASDQEIHAHPTQGGS